MDLLSEKGFPHLAMQVADLYLPTQLIEGEGSEVLASRIRALGHLRQMDKTHQLVTEVCIRENYTCICIVFLGYNFGFNFQIFKRHVTSNNKRDN